MLLSCLPHFFGLIRLGNRGPSEDIASRRIASYRITSLTQWFRQFILSIKAISYDLASGKLFSLSANVHLVVKGSMKNLWKKLTRIPFCSLLRYKVLRQMLYGCCALLVVVVLWGFHFYSPFTYGHVALSSAEINRRKWLRTWDMLSHPNTWHTSLPGSWSSARSNFFPCVESKRICKSDKNV